MKFKNLFRASPSAAASGAKVLVCSLDPSLHEQANEDSATYSRYYRHVDSACLSSVQDLLEAIAKGYDIVHVLSGLSSGGFLRDASGANLLGTDLITECCERGVKLLWIASDNNPDDYIKGFQARGKPLNLIMTISRRGARFSNFIEKLLPRVSTGETLPVVWGSLVPQAQGPWHEELPSCIFFAGNANAKLLS